METSGRGGLKVDTDNLGLSFSQGASTIGRSIVESSERGGGIFSGLLGNIFGGGGSAGGGLGGILSSVLGGGGGGGLGGILGMAMSLFGFKDGGVVGQMGAMNTTIDEALRREGSNSVLATLTPGEYVLNRSQQNVLNGILAYQGQSIENVLGFKNGGVVPGASAGVNLNQSVSKSGASFSNTINIQSSGNSEDDADFSRKLSQAIEKTTYEVIQREKKFSGQLYTG